MKQKLMTPKSNRLFQHGMLILNLGLAFTYVIVWLIAYIQGKSWMADFSGFYSGWAIVRDGLGSRLYDFGLQAQYQFEILGGRSFKDGVNPLIYPPGLMLLFTPLARLPLSTAYLVWTFGMACFLVWLIFLLWRWSAEWQPLERWLLVGAVVAFPPLLFTFLLGNVSLLMLVCFLQLYLALKHRRAMRAGIWFFIGIIKPQLMLAPGVMLASSRQWVALALAGLGSIAMILISTMRLGWQIWPNYLSQISTFTRYYGNYGFYPEKMMNFRGALTTLLGYEHAGIINLASLLALAAGFLATFLIWRGSYDVDQPEFDLRLAFTLTLALFTNLHLYPQDSLLYIMPALLFYNYLRQRNLPRRAYAVFLLLCPFIYLIFEFKLGASFGIRGPVLGVLILLGWIGKAWLDENGKGSLRSTTIKANIAR